MPSRATAFFLAAEGLDGLAALLRTASTCNVYRPREDSSGEQRALIASVLAPVVQMARALARRNLAGSASLEKPASDGASDGASDAPSMAAGRAAAHASLCATFDALIALDSLVTRPKLSVIVSHAAAAANPSATSLLVTLVATASAERQLPLLLGKLATLASNAARRASSSLETAARGGRRRRRRRRRRRAAAAAAHLCGEREAEEDMDCVN